MVRVIRNRNLFQKLGDNLHNFKLYGLLGVLTLVTGITFLLVQNQQDLRQRASGIESIEYGFNTHLNATGGTGYWENLTLDYFKRTVDDLVINKQKWIRFNVAPWESATSGTSQQINWNESALQKYDEALTYAKSKGLKVYLTTALPDFANSFTDTEFTDANKAYHTGLATRFKGKVNIWQVFNEADIHNFKGYTTLTEADLTDDYLSKLRVQINTATGVIKSVDPAVQFASNVTGYPLETKTFERWDKYFSIIASTVDVLALDIYPRWYEDINIIKSNVIGVGSKFGKPIIIAETGFPSGTQNSSEQIQGEVVPKAIDELRKALPIAIIYYQYSDTLPNSDKTESSFGVVKTDGSKKSSYDPIMGALAFPTGLLRIETNPAVGATITVTSLSTYQVVLTKTWGVDWEKLPIGEYKIKFSNPDNLKIFDKTIVLPPEYNLRINANETTTMIADLSTGKVTVTPILSLLTPTSAPTLTPSPIPTISTGLLRVETIPATGATINILKTNGQIVMSNTWSIDWKPLTAGSYYIQFSYPRTPGVVIPKTTPFSHYSNKVTVITGDFKTGKVSITYK